MSMATSKALVLTGAALMLAACNTTSDRQSAMPPPPDGRAMAMAPPAEVTGSIGAGKQSEIAKSAEAKPAEAARPVVPPEKPEAAEDDRPALVLPGDEPAPAKSAAAKGSSNAAATVADGRAAYRAGHFREAERLFRKAAQLDPRNSEAWLGVAASADRMRDFAQADKAYGKAREIAGPTAEILNNQGYSYMLRGDMKRARDSLTAARKLDPGNKYVENNLALLAANEGKARR